MSTKLSKEDVKSPDQVLKTLTQGFQWTRVHSTAVIVSLSVFIVIGLGSSLYGNYIEKKEERAQELFSQFEKSYLDKKRGFEEADREASRPNLTKEVKATPKIKASGDLEKDYGAELVGFKKIMDDHAKTKAAQMAALNLSEIYLKYKKTDEAYLALQKVEPQSQGRDLISNIVLAQYGDILSEKGDCKLAIAQWNKVLAKKEVQFLHDTLRLKSGFCYEKMNEISKAEELYRKVSQSPQDPQSGEAGLAKDAEKYLRLLNLKKTAEAKGS